MKIIKAMSEGIGVETAASNNAITPKETDTLDLLSFCRRAIGEWPAIDPVQGRLLNVEKEFSLLRKNNTLLITKQIMDTGPSPYFDLSGIPPTALRNLKCTKLTVVELYDITQQKETIQDIITFDKFLKIEGCNFPKGHNKQVTASLQMEDKRRLYWGAKLKDRDTAIVMGILAAVPSLAQKGYKYWQLPTGDKVPLNALKVLVLDVVPQTYYMIRTLRYEALINQKKKEFLNIRELEDDAMADRTPNIFMRRIHPELGGVFLYTVLGVKLPSSEKLYVVDPTSLQYGNAGPKKTLIMHGWWEEYETKFPGRILYKGDYEEMDYDFVVERMIEMGEGPRKFVTRLGSNLIKYLDRRSCDYCGLVEGKHHETPRMDFSYKHPVIALFNCGKCKIAMYCGKTCQKFDWPNHKGNCKSVE